jgi:cation diffusion facilitator family transporter
VTVVIAFLANLLVALAKSVAALLTGSASMTAEAAHSWADVGNETFLLVANRRGRGGPDDQHPMGYGREAYVWSMFAAIGLFTAGAVVSVMRGIEELVRPEAGSDYTIAYVVLAVSFVLEGSSFLQAYRQTRAAARRTQQDVMEYALLTSDPTLRAVFAEDSGALVGLLIAAGGISLHQVTGSPFFDALGSILVGLLLGVIGVVLIDRNRRFLVGQAVPVRLRRDTIATLAGYDEVDHVTSFRMEFIGPYSTFVVASIDIVGDDAESSVATRLRSLERRLLEVEYISDAVLTVSERHEPAIDH